MLNLNKADQYGLLIINIIRSLISSHGLHAFTMLSTNFDIVQTHILSIHFWLAYIVSCKTSRNISCCTKKLPSIGFKTNVCTYACGRSSSVY